MDHRKVHLLLAIAGLTGIVSLFLPFTFDVSPLYAVQDHYWWKMAAPFFLSVLVFVATIRWVISGSFTVIWKAIAYFISVASAYISLSLYFTAGASPTEFIEWLAFVVALVVLLFRKLACDFEVKETDIRCVLPNNRLTSGLSCKLPDVSCHLLASRWWIF